MQYEIEDYYRQGGESGRLSDGAGRWEFLRTWDLLQRTLPAGPLAVLDVGGATGVYAGPLASQGHRVHVVDPMPEHVAAAAALPGVTAAVGDARALTEPDAAYDAVLLLGPLYHLVARADRIAAWRGAARAVRPGGVVAAATISRFASLLDGYARGYLADEVFARMLERTLATGEHRNLGTDRHWFTTAYFHRPDEPAAEAAEAGLDFVRSAAVEGPLWMLPALDEVLAEPGRTEQALALMRQVEGEPHLWGASSHLLTVARRPA
ncbi:class I SAM-dependent methyltransferase [Catellatospora sp. KI3]|uniref:class I SAM-dependent methyltransferase n=1 Tax=Catellatospora sp. KI3 TaxID=3041620 RepID=UPI0024830C92|nr:class I SAM-dependent methyltransferase [Catellatospora sp. KI3]MDI1464484.1 class I SAM-dependent methyltransferase [Catellatospora sp. KI3]